jgi:uncharacterized membrane protein YeaQ/YmgE (transglycosylase-associated protein family)
MNMSIIGWIVLGAIAGWLASIVTGRNAQMGCIANIVVGIIGGLVGGLVMSFFGGSGVNGFNIPSLIVAVIGAVILLAIWNLISGRRAV